MEISRHLFSLQRGNGKMAIKSSVHNTEVFRLERVQNIESSSYIKSMEFHRNMEFHRVVMFS